MDNAYNMIYNGLYNVFSWMSEIQYDGISVLVVSAFCLFGSLVWRYFLSPIFGSGGSSLRISASDVVARTKASRRSEEKKK